MKHGGLQGTEKYIKERKKKKSWYKILISLSIVVMFCTFYALILPAITLETDKCKLSEHTHSESCYVESEEEPHVHTDECYIMERNELICAEHVHTEDCYIQLSALICSLQEKSGHQHTETCQGEDGVMTCEIEASEEHHHDGNCYEIYWELICEVDSTHQHCDDCYGWNKVSTCDLPTEAEQVLVCDMEEHIHTKKCNITEETLPSEKMETMVIDSSLPAIGTVYASYIKINEYSAISMDEELSDITEVNTPMNVKDYITKATLYYRIEEDGQWTNVQDAMSIPGDADFKLEINYGNVPIDGLLTTDAQMIYTLPELFRNAKINGNITSDSTTVGVITVEDGVLVLAFDVTWLQKQQKEKNTVISGDFFVEAEVNLSQIGEDGMGQIVIGNTTININFEGDIVAKYGNVDLSKTVLGILEEIDGDYLTYTLTVKAGADGCPDVKVADYFVETKYLEEYVGITGTAQTTYDAGLTETSSVNGESGFVYLGIVTTDENGNIIRCEEAKDSAQKPGILVWSIGDMLANETRTLTYRVKLKDNYTGIMAKGNLQNTANVYSKTYWRDSDTATFTPSAGATMTKIASEFIPNNTGGGTISYTIWVQAYDTNSYVLDNVKIIDALDGSIGSWSGTLAAIRQYLSYDEESFHLYQGGSKGQNGSSNLTEITEGMKLTFTDTNKDNKYNDSFTYYVGPLAPGESKTLIYTVNVEPGAFMAAGNADVLINNRACIYTDDSRIDGNEWLNGYNTYKTINRKFWSRKLVGKKQETEINVSMSGSMYDIIDGSIIQIASADSDFTVPVGSYKYQVVVNEAGDWNLSSASLTDSLGSQYMEFVGYVQVDAYTISSDVPGFGLDDEEAVANLIERTPSQTIWVKIDGKNSFNFTPEQIGLKGSQAYLLTYYAQPTNVTGITQVVVSNSFEMSGTVGIGNISYVLSGISVEASVVVEGDNSFTAEKQGWYYEKPRTTIGDFVNGALYWVIKVDGNVLPYGTAIRDISNVPEGEEHYIRNSSFVGVYTGNLETNSLADYADLDSLLTSKKLTALESSDYVITNENDSLTLTLKTKLSLAQHDSLYLIVKTEPSRLPIDKRDAFTYNNKLQSSSDGINWMDHNIASKTLYGSKNIFKELGRVFTYSGSGNSITDIHHGKDQAIHTSALNGAGTYAAWQIHVNYEGSLSGRYRVVEQIPDGMEVTYVRIWWLGYKAVLQDYKPTFVQLTAEEIAALGGNWTEYINTLPSNNIGNQNNYYYTNGQQVVWDIDNLVAGGGKRDDYAVEIQIVCKVTDPDVLLGGVSKEFNNVVSLQNSEGTTIGNDSNGVTIEKQTLSKQGTYNPETNGGRYPFKITLNELGEDLVSGSDSITLVDDLSDTLILDTTSIQVINTNTNEIVNNWTSSVEGQTLKIVLPDNLPLTITYEATVNAAPGQNVSIINNAHWEGYSTPSGGSVEIKEFHYATGGTVGADNSPTVTIKKLDQYNVSHALSGATFTLVEGDYSDGIFTPLKDGLSLIGTTDANETLTFGKTSDQTMKYNTIYCLSEIEAPEGYVLDVVPHYFAVAKKLENGEYPTFPMGVTVWYQSADYTYLAYNHKGEATVTKAFQDADGNYLTQISGTYRFGIYTEENPTENSLQTVTITYANNTVTPMSGTAKFTNLTLGTTYYIYELDDFGQPILDNTLAIVNGGMFFVTYADGPALMIPADGSATVSVVVTNRICYPELPQTGGNGTLLYTFGGFLLITFAMLFLLYNYFKDREKQITSS